MRPQLSMGSRKERRSRNPSRLKFSGRPSLDSAVVCKVEDSARRTPRRKGKREPRTEAGGVARDGRVYSGALRDAKDGGIPPLTARRPSIRAKALSRQKYPGRCVSTACFAREG